jgi:hypothetical protein
MLSLNRWKVLNIILRSHHESLSDQINQVVEKIIEIVQKILGQISSNFNIP